MLGNCTDDTVAMDGNGEESSWGINASIEESFQNIDEHQSLVEQSVDDEQICDVLSDVTGDVRDRRDVQGSTRDQRCELELDCSQVVKNGFGCKDRSSACQTVTETTGDSLNAEGGYMTNGGSPGDNQDECRRSDELLAAESKKLSRAFSEHDLCTKIPSDRVQSEESRLSENEFQGCNSCAKIVSKSSLLTHANVITSPRSSSTNYAAEKNHSNRTPALAEVLRIGEDIESSDEDLEEIVYNVNGEIPSLP